MHCPDCEHEIRRLWFNPPRWIAQVLGRPIPTPSCAATVEGATVWGDWCGCTHYSHGS